MSRQLAAEQCVKHGITPDHPQYEWCINDTATTQRAEAQQQAQDALLGGLLLGAAVNAAATRAPTGLYSDHGNAALVGQQTVGQQRQCLYNTPSGNVAVVVGLGTPCPASYAY